MSGVLVSRLFIPPLVAAFCLVSLLPAVAQETPAPEAVPADAGPAPADGRITLELNNVADAEGGACRMTFVAANHSGEGFDRTGWQVGVFDAQGIVRSILVLEFGELPDGKTKIVLFDLPGRGCADISRVVVNDVAHCLPPGGAADAQSPVCLDALTTRSRANIEFGV